MKSSYDNYMNMNMNMNMDISILICTHNSSKRIVDTLNSLKKQKGCENISWEIILVDYISSDGTLEILDSNQNPKFFHWFLA